MSAIVTHLRREHWQLFLSCTYRTEASMSAKIRYAMMFKFLRKVAEIGKLSFSKQLVWVVREELGEKTDRLHWHGLITGLPAYTISEVTCGFLMGYWEGIGGGMARIKRYDAELDAVGYCCKGLDESFQAGQAYEVGKFGTADTESDGLIIARVALAKWASPEVNDRHCRAQDMRQTARCDRKTGRRGNNKSGTFVRASTHPADAVGRLHV